MTGNSFLLNLYPPYVLKMIRTWLCLFLISIIGPAPVLADPSAEPETSSLEDLNTERDSYVAFLQGEDEVPWLYEDSNIPVDRDWKFGRIDNGLRYAVRRNRVPPGQVSIRVRIDAGSLHENNDEQGYAHLLEHLVFRESKYFSTGEAILTWQRLGATFGHDTNASTSPTQTVYNIDLPNISPETLENSFMFLSGMIRDPVLNDNNVSAEVPIVLAEMRDQGGASQRVIEATLGTLFEGQLLSNRRPIGTEETLTAATGHSLEVFHKRWYRPENTVVIAVGDIDPVQAAILIEKYFSDWTLAEPLTAQPNFGDPTGPDRTEDKIPIGKLTVLVEPDMPRSLTYAIMRPWRQVPDTVAYNQGLMIQAIAQAIVNRRLENRAREGQSFLFAQVLQEDISRSADVTLVSMAPLEDDWKLALSAVRGVISDALTAPPNQDEIDREVAEFESFFVSELEQKSVMAGVRLAENLVQAVDIRETVATPEVALSIFRDTIPRFNPLEIFAATKTLFDGEVVRGIYVTPSQSEASPQTLSLAMAAEVQPDANFRSASRELTFGSLPPIGTAGEIKDRKLIGLADIEQIEFANGVSAILWSNKDEPGRVSVKVRFGAGYREFEAKDAPYLSLGEIALVPSGIGDLSENDLDQLLTGRKIELNFAIEEDVFSFEAQTRSADVEDQLYLFAAKLANPGWDPSPFLRAKAAAEIGYDSYSSSPAAVIARDLEFYLRNSDSRWITPGPDLLSTANPEGFEQVWDPILKKGPVEVLVFGDFDREAVLEKLKVTFGALQYRTPSSPEVQDRIPKFPSEDTPLQVTYHRGDRDQAAAVMAWPTGGGSAGLREARQLEILVEIFNNRLMEALRERLGASYSPQVISRWPANLPRGGTIVALAQLDPEDIPIFFTESQRIADDLIDTAVSDDELNRALLPLRELYTRAATSNMFWLMQLENASVDPTRIALARTLLEDYSQARPDFLQLLARKYLGPRSPLRLAVVPEGHAVTDTNLSEVRRSREFIGR